MPRQVVKSDALREGRPLEIEERVFIWNLKPISLTIFEATLHEIRIVTPYHYISIGLILEILG